MWHDILPSSFCKQWSHPFHNRPLSRQNWLTWVRKWSQRYFSLYLLQLMLISMDEKGYIAEEKNLILTLRNIYFFFSPRWQIHKKINGSFTKVESLENVVAFLFEQCKICSFSGSSPHYLECHSVLSVTTKVSILYIFKNSQQSLHSSGWSEKRK